MKYLKKGTKVEVVKEYDSSPAKKGEVGIIQFVEPEDSETIYPYRVKLERGSLQWLREDAIAEVNKKNSKTRKQKRADVYDIAIKKFGVAAQIGMLTEEALELALAARKVARGFEGNLPVKTVEEAEAIRDNLAEEIADVEIMIAQAKQMFNPEFSKKIAYTKRAKIKRLKEGLEL